MEQPTAAKAVADRVTSKIKDRGTTVVWLCQKTGIPRATMTRRLGGNSPFNLNELDRIATALGVPVGDLLQPVTQPVQS